MGFNYEEKRKKIQEDSIVITLIVNQLLREHDLYMSMDEEKQQVIFVDRETFKVKAPLTARVPIGNFNSEVGDSLDSLKKRVEEEKVKLQEQRSDLSSMNVPQEMQSQMMEQKGIFNQYRQDDIQRLKDMGLYEKFKEEGLIK